MKARLSVPLRVAAVAAMASVFGVMSGLPATAESNAPTPGAMQVVNTETVQVYTDAVGAIETQRIYEQLAVRGKGTVDVRNPVDTDGLRNLDGFGGFDVEGGEQVATLTVDGEKHLRTVSDYSGKLPLDVSVEYFLDGKQVDPGDVVGESGKLEVKYTVKNVTAAPQQVTFDDGKGGTVTKTVDVPIPIVGSLTTVAPSSFTNVTSAQANMAGDGKGGTKMSFTMTLFPPIGSDTAEFGYTADITDGVVPRASITALPVNPLESPSFKTAGESYKGGAETGIALTDGATQIDENLLKLRDGAGQLLAGLIKLRDGAVKLDAGLSGVAAPGAKRLADGAGQLRDGVHKIDDGAARLADGAGQVRDGVGAAAAGGKKLSGGLGRLSTGAADLATGLDAAREGSRALAEGFNSSTGDPDFVSGSQDLLTGLTLIDGGVALLADASSGVPAAVEGAQRLREGVDKIRAGISNPQCVITDPQNPKNPCGLLEVLTALQSGFNKSDPSDPGLLLGTTMIQGGLAQLLSDDPAKPGLPVAKSGVDAVKQGITDALTPDSGSIDNLASKIGALEAYCLDPVKAACVSDHEKLKFAVNSADPADGFESLREKLAAADGGLGQVSAGLGQAITGVGDLQTGAGKLKTGLVQAEAGVTGLIGGVGLIQAGLSNPNCDPKNPLDPKNPCGLREGLDSLIAGLTEAATGLTQKLAPGTARAVAGATTLADKLALAGAGADQLADGMVKADRGAGKLAAGAGKAATGGRDLATGLGKLSAGSGELADGAGQLADGTGRAADGSSQVADGAEQLSDGLGDAADGSGQIADGLDKAAAGAPKLRDGAQRLSDEGTSKLVEAGKSTAQNYGEMYAVIKAGAERAQAEKMVYGAPKGAIGLAAYSYEIKGEDGEGGRNVTRGLGGVAVLGAAAAVFAMRRRLI